MTRTQKTIITILIILLLGTLAALGYVLFFKKQPTTPNTPSFPSSPDIEKPGQTGTGGQGQGTTTPGGTGTIPDGTSTSTPIGGGSTDSLPKLRRVSDFPTVGAVSFAHKDNKNVAIIRYIDRITGHTYETSSASLTTTKLTNTTIPKIQEAVWTPGGDSLYIRYTREDSEDIETYYAKIRPAQYELEGSFLERNILSIAIDAVKNRVFLLSPKTAGPIGQAPRGIGAISAFDAQRRTEVLNTAVRGWQVTWPNEKTLFLTTKPSGTTEGYSYFLNTETGRMDPVVGGIAGLTALSNNDASRVLYTESAFQSIATFSVNTKTSSTTPAPVATLPEKCVWSKKNLATLYCAVPSEVPSGTYPDDWYQGQVSFEDNLWKIDMQNNTSLLLMRPQDNGGVASDMISLFLDPSENYVYFINKKDGYLWSYDVRGSLF